GAASFRPRNEGRAVGNDRLHPGASTEPRAFARGMSGGLRPWPRQRQCFNGAASFRPRNGSLLANPIPKIPASTEPRAFARGMAPALAYRAKQALGFNGAASFRPRNEIWQICVGVLSRSFNGAASF